MGRQAGLVGSNSPSPIDFSLSLSLALPPPRLACLPSCVIVVTPPLLSLACLLAAHPLSLLGTNETHFVLVHMKEKHREGMGNKRDAS